MLTVKVKICGITSIDDALYCIDHGADMLGFVFYPKSPRYLSPQAAARIVARSGSNVGTIGVFVNEEIKNLVSIVGEAGVSGIQLHGDEPPEYIEDLSHIPVVKAFQVTETFDLSLLSKYQVDAFLLDAYDQKLFGGTGKTFNWDIARQAKTYGRIILAGGLTAENVRKAIAQVEPYAVDVSSGVESAPGKKDRTKVKEFLAQAKGSPS